MTPNAKSHQVILFSNGEILLFESDNFNKMKGRIRLTDVSELSMNHSGGKFLIYLEEKHRSFASCSFVPIFFLL
jgi:hypothetical protein